MFSGETNELAKLRVNERSCEISTVSEQRPRRGVMDDDDAQDMRVRV